MAPEAITCIAAVVTSAAAAAGGFLVRGSTAVPAAAWATVAALALAVEAGCRAAGGLGEPAAHLSARLLVAALGVCPVMSLLGAKRPQHGVWQLIVATLACVLAMPAVSAALVRPGSMPDVHLLQRGFLPILVAVGCGNFVGTRHGFAAAGVAAGQAALMWPLLPGVAPHAPDARIDAWAACRLAAAAVLAAWQSLRGAGRRAPAHTGPAAWIDRPFLALRETLGVAWTLRIAERFNAVAAARGWPCRLTFGGLEVSGSSPTAWERDAVRCCRSILRRFVSVAWLERHGGLQLSP